MAVDLKLLEMAYFTMDEPVPYSLNKKDTILIYPIVLKDVPLFMSCCDILSIRKNEQNSIEIIQMSYLEFLVKCVLKDEASIKKLYYILNLCLKLKSPRINVDEHDNWYLTDDDSGVIIKAKQFDDIRRIIMYQNIVGYDDEYIDSDLRKAIEETKALKCGDIDMPSLERKIAIISSHCGISKKEQMQMTYRSHEMLFQEVCGEIEFVTIRPVALYGGQGDKIDHWIYKKKKGKFDDYLSPVDDVKTKFGNGMVSK